MLFNKGIGQQVCNLIIVIKLLNYSAIDLVDAIFIIRKIMIHKNNFTLKIIKETNCNEYILLSLPTWD